MMNNDTELFELLSDTELIRFMDTLGFIYGKYDDQQFHKFDSEVSGSTITRNHAKQLYEDYHTQKRLYAEIVIGEDESGHYTDIGYKSKKPKFLNTPSIEQSARNELRAEQRARIK